MLATNALMAGLRNAMASMMTTGRAFGEARQHQRPGCENFGSNLVAADPACYSHVLCDERLDLAAHFTIACEHQFELGPALRQHWKTGRLVVDVFDDVGRAALANSWRFLFRDVIPKNAAGFK
jgi:hypothetical protein